MHCIKKITNDLTWVGVNDRRLAMFEGVYSVPNGVSYNSYLLTDEKTVLFDTVDAAVRERFFENIAEALSGRSLDYLVVQHMEPDHSAVIMDLLARYPKLTLVCNEKTLGFLKQFFDFDIEPHVLMVEEASILDTGSHKLCFIMAPMVHWPEVMVTYDTSDKILFSADAFGCFGALNGALFADEVDFKRDYMDEARRYYTNIVGKYGTQVQTLLGKASEVSIEMICPLHGFVWRKGLGDILAKYNLWSSYEPEEQGVMIAYASVYGHTENAAELLASKLRDKGIKTVMFDVSVTPASEIVSAAFQWSHLVFASTTYNAGIFVAMEALIFDLVAHNLQNRTIALIENGSWAPTSGGLMHAELEKCKDIRFIENTITINSSLKEAQRAELDAMAEEIAATFPSANVISTNSVEMPTAGDGTIAREAILKLSYGLYVLTAAENGIDNGCIINTVQQVTDVPARISVAVNKLNHTHDMVLRTGVFNVSILSEDAKFGVFERFGFHSGRDTDKFAGYGHNARTVNGVRYLPEATNAVISAKVTQVIDCGTHTVFIAEVSEAFTLSNEPSVTYQYYFEHIKPKPQLPKEAKSGYICKICGYIHEGDDLPPDFICPLCKHGVEDFERIG